MHKTTLALTLTTLLAAPVLAVEPVVVVIGGTSTEIAGKVMVINRETRLMTLKQADGKYKVLHVPMEVERIDRIKIGDQVALSEMTTVTIELDKGKGKKPLGAEASTVVERTGGSKPAGTITDDLTFHGKVAAVNKAAGTVTIQGAKDVQTFNVQDRALLNRFSVGDGVFAHITNRISGEVKVR